MTSLSRLCGKNSWRSFKYSQSYDNVCKLALLGLIDRLILVDSELNITLMCINRSCKGS